MPEYKDRDRRHIHLRAAEQEPQPEKPPAAPGLPWEHLLETWLSGHAPGSQQSDASGGDRSPARRTAPPSKTVTPQLREALGTWLRGRMESEARRESPPEVVFARLQRLSLREVLDAVADQPELRAATIEAADPAIAPPVRSRSSRGRADAGAALWRASERRAVTLYRRALDHHQIDEGEQSPAIAEALERVGSGQPLPSELRRQMDAEFGVSFARVRIHTDAVAVDAAAAVNAEAFTVGEDVFFGAGAFDPVSKRGQKLIAHELQHVVQSWSGRTTSPTRTEVSKPDDPLEHEAEAAAERVGTAEPRNETKPLARPAARPTVETVLTIYRAPKDGSAKTPASKKKKDGPPDGEPKPPAQIAKPVPDVARADGSKHGHDEHPPATEAQPDAVKQPANTEAAPSQAPATVGAPITAPLATARPAQHTSKTAGNGDVVGSTLARETARVSAAFDAAEGEIQQTALTQQAQVHATGVAKAAQLAAELDQRGMVARAGFATARANLTTVARTQAALARSEAKAAATRLREDFARQRGRAIQKASAEGERMIAAARKAGAQIILSYVQTKAVVVARVEEGLSVADQELEGGDRDTAKTALQHAKRSICEHMQDRAQTDADELVAAASRNQTALINNAGDLFTAEHGAKIEELAKATLANGEQLAGQFNLQLAQALQRISIDEQIHLARIDQLKASATGLIGLAASIAQRVGAVGSAQVAGLSLKKGATIAQIETATHQALEKLQAYKPAPAQRQAAAQLISDELTKLTTAVIGQTGKAGGSLATTNERFRAMLDARIATIGGQLDQAQAQISKPLADATTKFTAQCTTTRTTVQGVYAGAFAQISAPGDTGLQAATAHWRSQADLFIGKTGEAITTGVRQHTQVITQLPGELRHAAIAALAEKHTSRLVTAWNTATQFVATLVGGAIVVIGLTAIMPFAAAVALVGAVALGLGLTQRLSSLMSQWEGWSLGEKIGGVLLTVVASVGDLVGATSFIEGLFHTEAVTNRSLSDNESTEKLTTGFLSLVTLGLASKFAPKIKGFGDSLDNARMGRAGKNSPAKALPETTSSDTKAAETKPIVAIGETKPIQTNRAVDPASPEPIKAEAGGSEPAGKHTETHSTDDTHHDRPGGPGAAHVHDEEFSTNRTFEGSKKHTATARSIGGDTVGKEPTNGQAALDFSFPISPNTPRRVGIDVATKEFVVFDRTGNRVDAKRQAGGIFHGHVRTWEMLSSDMKKALIKQGLVDKRGRITIDSNKWDLEP